MQFVTPAAPPPPPPVPELDDDVWGEDLPEDALQEAILLESQQYTEPSAQPTASHQPAAAQRNQQQQRQRPAAVAADGAAAAAPEGELQRLRRDNTTLTDQLKTARADIFSHQGKVSVLREELTRRCRELENCRLESSRQRQEQQLSLEQSTRDLNRDLDALRTELQFKTHELAEMTRQCRSRRDSPGHTSSPPRKAARLDSAASSPAVRRRFITSAEFRRPETGEAQMEAVGTQTEPDSQQSDIVGDEVPPCHLVAAVLSASGDAQWLGEEALSALAGLADRAVFCAERAGRAADLVAAAAVAWLNRFPACVERLRTASDADRRLGTLGSGRRRAAALLALLREEAAAAPALWALRRLAEWGAPLSVRLARHAPLVELLPRLLRPAIADGEVRNILIMEYTATLLATMASYSLPDSLIEALEPAVHEVFNTKPPARLLSALLELLISTAGTGQISGFWCRPTPTQKHTGTCLVKKLSILFSERAAPSDLPIEPSYRLPANHSRHGPTGPPSTAGPPAAAAALRADPSPAELRLWTAVAGAWDVSDGAADSGWRRLVALVLSRPASLPGQACCRSHLTLLVVQLLHSAVHHWQHGGGGDDAVDTAHLLSALHRLADLDPAFSDSVSRERLRYLATMETLGGCWRSMQLSAQHVGVLQELYKFEPGTFDGASQSSQA